MTTSIAIEGLKIYAYHGILEQERRVGNLFEVSLSITYDFSKAIESDSLDVTISYAYLCELIRREMSIPSGLLEHVAGRIMKAVRNNFSTITHGCVTVKKLTPPISMQMNAVGVKIEW